MAHEKAGTGKRPLTMAQIDAHVATGQQSFIWDSKLSGFGVRVTAGSKSFILQTRIAGRPVRLTIGAVNVWSIDEARKHARGLLVQIDQGVDPRAIVKTESPSESAADKKLIDWWPQYLEAGKPRGRAAFKPTYLMHLKSAGAAGGVPRRNGGGVTVKGPLYDILQTRLGDLDVYRLRDWFEAELKVRPGQAVKALRMLQGYLRWLRARDATMKQLVDRTVFLEDEIQSLIPARKKRTDRIPADKIDAWLDACLAHRDRVVGTYLIGLLLTGCRRMELATLKWSSIKGRLMTVNDKVNETRTIPVGCVLEGLLSNLPRTSEYVFPARTLKSKSGCIGDPRVAAQHIATEAGLEYLTLHGLRRTFSLMADRAGIPTGAAAQIMGHSIHSVIQAYKPRTPDDLIEYADKVQSYIFKRGTK